MYNKKIFEKAMKVLEAAINRNTKSMSRIESIALHTGGYAEPGYTDPESGIIALGNWNSFDKYNREKETFETICDIPSRLSRLFEKWEIAIEWSDEWAVCDNCQKLVRTSPSSYGWQQYFWLNDCCLVCGDCVKEDPSEYIEYLKGNEDACCTFNIKLEKHGYKRLDNSFEHGWHPGQDDDPKKIAASLRKRGIDDFIFYLDSTGQFDINFSVWIPDNTEAFLSRTEVRADVSPHLVLSNALKNLPIEKVEISAEDFVEGKLRDKLPKNTVCSITIK